MKNKPSVEVTRNEAWRKNMQAYWPHITKLYEECELYGVVYDIGERWENGIAHHRKAMEMYDLIEKADFAFAEDHFCWKSGGDGDNGEALMYSLSIMYELDDAREKAKLKEWKERNGLS